MDNTSIEAAQEFLTDYGVFEKTNMIRRTSDLIKRVANSGPHMVLPKNVMLHMFDNISHSDQSTDTFDETKYPFLNTKGTMKYLHHFTDLDAIDKQSLSKFSHRIYRSKLIENLKRYSIDHRKLFIPALKLDPIIGNKNVIIIENYNPLYRMLATSLRPIYQYYRYRAFMTTILQNTIKYDRQHVLVIPVPDTFTYVRSTMLAIVQSKEVSAQRLSSGDHFSFFIIDLISLLLDNNTKLSTFNQIGFRYLKTLNIMLTHKDKSIIFNIGKLASLAKTKSYVFSFIDNISRISGVNIPVTELPDENADDDQPDQDESDDVATDTQPIISVTQKQEKELQNIIQNAPDLSKEKEADKTVNSPPPDTGQTLDETPISKPDESSSFVEIDAISRVLPIGVAPSQKQIDRIAALSTKHLSITIPTSKGFTTIKEILNTPVDIKVEPTALNIHGGNDIEPSMMLTATKAFDQGYHEKLFRKDIIESVVSFKENGLFLTDYNEKNEYNSFTRVKHVKATFHDIKGKQHTINFKLPMPDSEGYYLVNGVRLSMSKQLVNIPICKISPTRVSLISNYNKTLVDKVQSSRHSLSEYLANKAGDLNIKLIPHRNTYVGITAPYDYKQLGASFGRITTETHTFFFDYHNRYEEGASGIESLAVSLEEYESKYGVLMGYVNENKQQCVFMNASNLCVIVDLRTGNIVEKDTPISSYFGEFQVPTEWCDLKILDKNLPIVFILGYRYGLTAILKNLKIKHRIVKLRETMHLKNTEIAIIFSDCKLIFDRYPLEHSYILAGFSMFPTMKNYTMLELDDKDVYYRLLSDKGMSMNYLKGIDAYFNFFIDPITKDVLQRMGEPTNTRDLLIRSIDLLVNTVDKSTSAASNFRLRSTERLPAMIYNEIARQYANYINSNFKDSSFSINTEAIFQRIIQDETMTLREDLNPIHAIKEVNRVTYSGFGGRSSEAFVARDRKYPRDAIGILAETTTDSGSVGMVTALTGNPKIKNLRGMFETDSTALNTTNILSDVALLMPNSTHNDPKRSNFSNVQITHHIPTPNLKPMRLRTGYELVIPQKTSGVFVGKAKYDGVITGIDSTLGLVSVTYSNKTTDVFEYGDIRGESSGMAVNHKIGIVPDMKVGSRFKKDDPIVYHSEFFQFDPITRQLAWCHGVPANVAIMAKDVTLEDSSMISAEFASKLKFDSIYARPITITSDMIIDNFADIGTKVAFNDSLIQLRYEDTMNVIDNVDELFDDLKQVNYRCKHEGEIVDIQVYHVAETLNESLTRFVNKVTYKARRKANVAKGTVKEASLSHVSMVPAGTRIRGVQLGDTDLLIVFHIKSSIENGIGDKIVVAGMLKSVIGRIESRPMTADTGDAIDVVFGSNSLFDRITPGELINGISDKILEKAEEDVLKMYFDE